MAKAEEQLVAERKKAREVMYSALDKKVGKGLARAVQDQEIEPIIRQSFGSIKADWVAGGGVPYGRITEIYGAEGSGKTTLALSILGQAQRVGRMAGLVDAEHNFDPEWATILGVNVPDLMLLQPDNGEQGFQALEVWLEHGVQAIVIDSVSALVPKAELEGDVSDAHVGRQARLMSQGLRRLTGTIARAESAVMFINQLREKVGNNYGSPETTSGGRALKFYASLRLDCRRGTHDEHMMYIKLKSVKNRGNAQYRKGEVSLAFGLGLDPAGEVVDLGAEAGFIEKSGAWYSYGAERMGQGREAAVQWLRDRPDVLAALQPKASHFLETGELSE